MKKNIGTPDRLLRLTMAVVVGAGILFTDSIIMQGILAVVSLFILYEAVVGWCALYQLIGKNSCPISFDKPKGK
jgi:hypothetical protein